MRRGSLFCVFLLLSSPALAAADNSEYFPPIVLPPTLLEPPPAAHSDAWKAEVKHVIDAQKKVTDKHKKSIVAEEHFGPEIFAASIPNWDAKHYPHTFQLLSKAHRTCNDVTEQDKKFWNTRRPYIEEPKIKSLAGNVKNGSYPSGHTSCSHVMAETLGQIVPKKLADFRKRASQVARHRIMAGVHYPSDIKGGEQLSLLIMGALEQSNEFHADLEAAKAEFAK